MTFLILTFLPHHTSSIFLSLLTIIPERRPAAFKFLQPYIQSSTIPPRHTIVHTAAYNQEFFNALNAYALKVCRSEQQYPILVSFWSSITSEAVSSMLSRSRLGRLELQKQNQEDVLRRVIPWLAEGLAMRHSSDLRIGCYMVLTVLSSNANLSEELITALMEMVVHEWNDVTHAGLICLVILAQKRQASALPKKVSKALIAIEHLADDLVLLSKNYKVGKLVLGLILGKLKRLVRAGDADRLRSIRILMEANLMQPELVAAALRPMLRILQSAPSSASSKDGFDTRSALSDLILCLADSETAGPVTQAALGDMGVETQQLGFSLLGKHAMLKDVPETPEEDVEMHDVGDDTVMAPFEDLAKRIPAQTAFEMSLLSHSESYIFPSLSDTFLIACQSQKNLDAFSELPVLRKSLAQTEPFFVSFFARVWCSHFPTQARIAALRALSKYFSTGQLMADVQVLLPYILHALADPIPSIRRVATELVIALVSSYKAVGTHHSDSLKLPILGKGQIYGQGKESDRLAWLSWQDVGIFLQDWLVPQLEEIRLHADQIGRSIVNALAGTAERQEAENGHQRYKKSLRANVLTWLCSHVVDTPMYAVKARLLPILTRVTKVGQIATVTLLTQFLVTTLANGQSDIKNLCDLEDVDPSRYIDCVMDIATPDDKDSIKLLQDWISNSQTTAEPLLLVAAFRRLRNLWSLFKQQSQDTLGRTMLDLAMGDLHSHSDTVKQREALDFLRTVELSSDTLHSFLQECPSLSESGSKRSAKRRRTASPHSGDGIKYLSLVLEIVESSVKETHFPLLGRLSRIMADLQGYKQRSGIELHYLELLTMNSMRGILEHSGVCSNLLVLCR